MTGTRVLIFAARAYRQRPSIHKARRSLTIRLRQAVEGSLQQ
jgi:hypothetical protein